MIVGLPLFLTYNETRIVPAMSALLGTLTLSNLFLLYPGVGSYFLRMLFSTRITTALYPYAAIPLAEVVFLSFISYREILIGANRILRRLRPQILLAEVWSASHR
ncbi:hypothetical protein AUI06_06745 [archaeon 13_2_20CM_2_52_21]|nr:MAG: hypothetical protein AUI06_06745 [archaeon 13_2_20CM_2_52_21]